MILEALYPEVCSLYGDMANMRYLRRCLPGADYRETSLNEEPLFASEDVDLLYIGTMTEPSMEKVLDRLMPLRDRLLELRDRGCILLFTGNAMGLLGEKIVCAGREIPALGIYPFLTRRNMEKRVNCHFLGTWNELEIVGCKSQWDSYEGVTAAPFLTVTGGMGNCAGDPSEGIADRGLFATSLLGPLLVLNPLFTKELMRRLGSDVDPAFFAEAMEAYAFRLKELKTEGAQFYQYG